MLGINDTKYSESYLKEQNSFLESLLCSKKYGILCPPEPLPTIQELNWLSIYITAFPKSSPLNRLAFGVGVSSCPDIAKMKALFEGIERHAVFSSPPATFSRLASVHELQENKEKFVHPNELGFFKFSNTEDQVRWHRSIQSDESSPSTYYPYAIVKGDKSHRLAEAHSSGFSCHENLDLATSHAYLELLERDHFLSHWWLKKPFLKIEKDTLPQSLRQSLSFYLGGLFSYIDFFCELGTNTPPSIFTRWRNKGHRGPAFLIGGSCHPTPEKALWSSLLEVLVNLNSVILSEPTPDRGLVSNFDLEIRFPMDRIRFYQHEINAQVTDYYFESSQSIHWKDVDQAVPFLEQDNVLYLNMTTNLEKTAGCTVVRAVAPNLIPMDGAHAQRPRWHPKLKISEANLNILQTYPHPYP